MSSLDLRTLPKAELHLHFEAAMSRESAATLADASGLPAPSTGPYRDLSEFVVGYERARDIIGSLDDLRALARDLGARQRAAGVVWTEVHFIPATYAGRLGAGDALVEAVVDGLSAGAGDGHAGLVIGVNRGRSLQDATAMLDLALRWVGSGVVAFGLAGDEAHHPVGGFVDLFRRAVASGLPVVPHAGEAAGPDEVRGAVERLGATRVCHGVRAAEDDAVVGMLVEREVVLDMAPVSNVLLRIVPDLAAHPLPVLMRRGVPVTLSTDIPLFTGVDIVEEYRRCIDAWGLSDGEVVGLARTSVQRSHCPQGVREQALKSLDAIHI